MSISSTDVNISSFNNKLYLSGNTLKVWDEEKINAPLKLLITIIGCILTVTSDWSCTAPLAILMVGRNHGNFHKQMIWLMAIITVYAIAFYISLIMYCLDSYYNNHFFNSLYSRSQH